MTLTTPWGAAFDADAPLPEYPRPQLVRDGWLNLNGRWRYAITPFEGGGLDVTLTPFYDKVSRTKLGIVAASTDQVFGHWAGSFTTADGELVEFDGILGFAEHVHNRW